MQQSVLLPNIRQIIPNLIASQIVGVQPITGPVGAAFSMKYSNNYGDKKFMSFLRDLDKIWNGRILSKRGDDVAWNIGNHYFYVRFQYTDISFTRLGVFHTNIDEVPGSEDNLGWINYYADLGIRDEYLSEFCQKNAFILEPDTWTCTENIMDDSELKKHMIEMLDLRKDDEIQEYGLK